MSPSQPRFDTQAIVRRYHDGWSTGRFDDAIALLAENVQVEVPVNDYPTRASSARALIAFGSLVERVVMLSELAQNDEAMLLYDMHVSGLGRMRVAEHFTVRHERIVRLRQIHDTAGLRAAGFVS